MREVVNLDQTTDLASFQESLRAVERMLCADSATFAFMMDKIFDSMRGSLSNEQWARLCALRRCDQDVVFEIWASVFKLRADELAAMVTKWAGLIAAPHLSWQGTDPGRDRLSWLTALLP